jgi:hypothetical protein
MTPDALTLTIVNKALRRTIQEGQTSLKVDPKRSLYLRPSQLPYCALRQYFNLPKLLVRSNAMDFGSTFYTRVGTAVHTVLQEAMQSIAQKDSYCLFDWICRDCKTRHSLHKDLKVCTNCGSRNVYADEHEINLPWIQGHIDNIIVSGKYAVIVDYKTTSSSALASKGKPLNYTTQIGTYCTLMKPVLAKLGLELIGWALIYVARDNHKFKVVTGSDFTPIKLLRQWSVQHQRVLNLTKLSEVKELVQTRICKTKEDNNKFDSFCSYRNVCTTGNGACKKHALSVYGKLEGKLPVINLFK